MQEFIAYGKFNPKGEMLIEANSYEEACDKAANWGLLHLPLNEVFYFEVKSR